ncbi:MAG TPA: hypothetical protein VFR78_20550 [Pyrinomonadaceae bacterium]|nr:hypothetical protein [Pyrinomonadaceae bacterium]
MVAFILCLALLFNISVAPVDDKIRVEDVVLKHLEAIGTDQARRSGRSRIVAGSSMMNLRTGGRGNVSGPALIASHEKKVLLKAEFTSASYPFEKLGFDGRKFAARQFAPGSRSPLAQFFMSHDVIFSEGLIGGVLSSAWPLLNISEREPKVQYIGTEKIKGRQAHKVRYTPRSGGELKITMYFDAESLNHLRTDYERVVPASMGATPGESASQRETRYKLVEDFSDFKREGDLTLPHTYNIQFTIFQTTNPLALDWTITLSRFTFDYPIEVKEFAVDS